MITTGEAGLAYNPKWPCTFMMSSNDQTMMQAPFEIHLHLPSGLLSRLEEGPLSTHLRHYGHQVRLPKADVNGVHKPAERADLFWDVCVVTRTAAKSA